MPPEARPHPAQRLPCLLIALAFLLVCALWDHFLLPGTRNLWDARVYAHAIAAFRAGSDPYSLADGGLPFVYPPLFLYAGALLAHLIHGRPAWILYLAVLTASTLAISWLLATQYLRTTWLTPAIALTVFVLQPRLFGEIVFLSGNLGAPLYALILMAALPGLRRNRWLWFYLAIILAALIKPPFLAFLVLPLFAATRQLLPTLATAAATLAAYAAQARLLPTLFAAFQDAVRVQLIVRQDAGFGFLAWFLKFDQRLPRFHGLIAPCAYLAVMAALILALIVLRRRAGTAPDPALWLPLLLVFAILANPRMQAYDAEIAVLPAIVLCVECIRVIPATPRRTAFIAASLALLTALLSRDAQAAVFLLFTAAILLALRTLAQVPRTT